MTMFVIYKIEKNINRTSEMTEIYTLPLAKTTHSDASTEMMPPAEITPPKEITPPEEIMPPTELTPLWEQLREH